MRVWERFHLDLLFQNSDSAELVGRTGRGLLSYGDFLQILHIIIHVREYANPMLSTDA